MSLGGDGPTRSKKRTDSSLAVPPYRDDQHLLVHSDVDQELLVKCAAEGHTRSYGNGVMFSGQSTLLAALVIVAASPFTDQRRKS
jgi:hypothetical protein